MIFDGFGLPIVAGEFSHVVFHVLQRRWGEIVPLLAQQGSDGIEHAIQVDFHGRGGGVRIPNPERGRDC